MDLTSVASGAGSLVGGLFSMFGANQSSKRALQATRETNEQNYRIWQEQQQHNIDMFNMENQANIDMWNMQNEYNDPAAQAQRLRDAGFNPDMALGNNPSGMATSAPASASAQPAGAPTMQTPSDVAFQSPLTAFANGSLQGLVQLASAFNTIQDTKGKQQKLPFEIEGLKLGNRLTGENINNAKKLGIGYDYDNELKRLTRDFEVEYKKELVGVLQADKLSKQLDNKAKKIMNEWLPVEKQTQFLSSCYNLFLMGQRMQLNEQELKNLVKTEYEIMSRTRLNNANAQNAEDQHKLFDKTFESLWKSLKTGYDIERILNSGAIDYLGGEDPNFYLPPYKVKSNPNIQSAVRRKFGVSTTMDISGEAGLPFGILGLDYKFSKTF